MTFAVSSVQYDFAVDDVDGSQILHKGIERYGIDDFFCRFADLVPQRAVLRFFFHFDLANAFIFRR